ncbi:MAG: DUF4136 domain-containing protein [Gammaproteobacteria bacterium]|jgi:hypothetical protein|nr:DUF4136 domain-containing protein [Gammaproteobacteria bacterium]
MTIRSTSSIIMAFVSLALAACASTFEATYDSDPAQDFSGYKTWGWISENPMILGSSDRIPNPLLQPKIMQTIEDGLAVKGFTRVDDTETADFAVSFTVGSREEIRVDSYPSTYGAYGMGGYPGWGGAYYGYGYGYGATETRVRQTTKGMLGLDIFDVEKRQPVFHAVGTKTISDSDRENIDETIQAAVDSVLAAFPPPPPGAED